MIVRYIYFIYLFILFVVVVFLVRGILKSVSDKSNPMKRLRVTVNLRNVFGQGVEEKTFGQRSKIYFIHRQH